jgi:hypothetical protein
MYNIDKYCITPYWRKYGGDVFKQSDCETNPGLLWVALSVDVKSFEYSGILEKKHLSRMIQHFYGTWSRSLASNTWSILNERKAPPSCLIPAIMKKSNLYGWTFYRGLYQPLKLGEHASSNTDLVSMFFGIAPVFKYWFYNVQGEVSPGILVGFGWSRFWLFSSMIQ